MMIRHLVPLLLILLVFTGSALAEFYTYTDSRGEQHFVDDIAKVPKKYRKQLREAGAEGNVNVTDATPTPPVQQERPEPKRPEKQATHAGVELFMTSWCGYCKKMVRFLNEKGIPYTAYDIEKDSAALQTYRGLGGRGVPVVKVGTHVVHGYNPEAVASYYNGGR